MSYQPVGKRFKLDSESYCLGVAEDDLGMRVVAIYKNVGGQWVALTPVLQDNVQCSEIMDYGSVSGYLNWLLPRASEFLRNRMIAPKPEPSDKIACVGYDLALDVDFNPDTMSFALNKQPPLSHAR